MATRDEILAADFAHVWHPYAPAREELRTDPFVIARANGVWLEDVNGARYIDGNSSWWTATLGHSHPRLLKVLQRQAETLAHTAFAGITHEPGALLAKELVAALPPGFSRVFYTDNGSTAIEAALRIALQFWEHKGQSERTTFVALNSAFHGDTLGATSLGGIDLFTQVFRHATLKCVHVTSPTDGYDEAFAHLARTLETSHRTIAAVVVEPLVQGAAGMRTYDAKYLADLAALCHRFDVLLIVDEVFTGFGRTGTMWACEQAGISPDIVCLGKAFASLLPMGATVVTDRIAQEFVGGRLEALMYGHTFAGHPLGAALAREVLAIFREENIVASLAPKAAMIRRTFESLPHAHSARALGMIGAADFGGSGYLGDAGWRIFHEAKKRGAYLRPLGDTVYVCPPLTISEAELGTLLSIVNESVRAVFHY